MKHKLDYVRWKFLLDEENSFKDNPISQILKLFSIFHILNILKSIFNMMAIQC